MDTFDVATIGAGITGAAAAYAMAADRSVPPLRPGACPFQEQAA